MDEVVGAFTGPDDIVNQSIGGVRGHILRRAIHLSMAAVPIAYYWHGDAIGGALGITKEQIAASVILALLAFEVVRLSLGFTVFGQRAYESKQISALAWGGLAVGLTLLIAPSMGTSSREAAALGFPLIMSLVLGDPLLGELRRTGMTRSRVVAVSVVAMMILWSVCASWLGTPWLLVVVLAPLTVISEWPRLTYIDDNATMLLIPLAAVLVLDPFFAWSVG